MDRRVQSDTKKREDDTTRAASSCPCGLAQGGATGRKRCYVLLTDIELTAFRLTSRGSHGGSHTISGPRQTVWGHHVTSALQVSADVAGIRFDQRP